jgi:syntaxin 1B/2/3
MISEEVFTATSPEEARKLVDEMHDRHTDLMEIEKNIVELHQLFMDMSLLVDQQGEKVNNIEQNVQSSANNTEKAVTELKASVELQKSARKKKWCMVIFCLVLIIILVIVGVVYLKPMVENASSKPANNSNSNSAVTPGVKRDGMTQMSVSDNLRKRINRINL